MRIDKVNVGNATIGEREEEHSQHRRALRPVRMHSYRLYKQFTANDFRTPQPVAEKAVALAAQYSVRSTSSDEIPENSRNWSR